MPGTECTRQPAFPFSKPSVQLPKFEVLRNSTEYSSSYNRIFDHFINGIVAKSSTYGPPWRACQWMVTPMNDGHSIEDITDSPCSEQECILPSNCLHEEAKNRLDFRQVLTGLWRSRCRVLPSNSQRSDWNPSRRPTVDQYSQQRRIRKLHSYRTERCKDKVAK